MNKLLTLTVPALLAACIALPASAELLPRPGKADARVRFVTASSSNVVKVRISMRYLTTFEFGKSENIISYALGDSESFQHEKSPTKKFLLIKALVPGAGTNLIVYTDRNTYLFELVTGKNSDPKIYRVKVDPPNKKATSKAVSLYRPPVNGAVKGNYTKYYSAGSGDFKPVAVWDDGKNTFIRFKRNARRPAIFRTNASGRDISTNAVQVSDTVVQVEGVGNAWTLRIGSETVCILRGSYSKARMAQAKARIEYQKQSKVGGS